MRSFLSCPPPFLSPPYFLTPVLLCHWVCTMGKHCGRCPGGHIRWPTWTWFFKGHEGHLQSLMVSFPRGLWKSQHDKGRREGGHWLLSTSGCVPGSVLDTVHTLSCLILSTSIVVSTITSSYRWWNCGSKTFGNCCKAIKERFEDKCVWLTFDPTLPSLSLHLLVKRSWKPTYIHPLLFWGPHL